MKLFRGRTLMIFGVAAIAGAVLLHMSQKVGERERELARLTASVKKEQETIKVLQAEWAYLNSPRRLESLAARYLEMKKPSAEQFAVDYRIVPDVPEVVIPASKPDALFHNIAHRNEVRETVSHAPVFEGPAPVVEPSAQDVIVEGSAGLNAPQPGRKPVSSRGNFGDLLGRVGKAGAQ
jgi:hypothetical protein